VTAQLERHFSGGTEVSAAYTYTDARDRMGMVADRGSDLIRSTPVDGTLEERNVRTSIWERPRKITFVGTTDLPFGLRLGVTYIGMSGQPYTYVLQGDPNADGLLPRDAVSNDVVYVPKDAGDITLADATTFAALDEFIRKEPCLQRQRARLRQLDSDRHPWAIATTAPL